MVAAIAGARANASIMRRMRAERRIVHQHQWGER
jgi:hypothetical protein